MLTLAKEARQRGWWQSYSSDAVPEWFRVYLGLEAAAAAIHEYAAELVPGLFQTADYYRAFLQTAPVADDEETIERKIAVRIERQDRLTAADAPGCWAVLNEAVIRRMVGGAQVMRTQLQHIVELAQDPRLNVQVLPYRAGAHPAVLGEATRSRALSGHV